MIFSSEDFWDKIEDCIYSIEKIIFKWIKLISSIEADWKKGEDAIKECEHWSGSIEGGLKWYEDYIK